MTFADGLVIEVLRARVRAGDGDRPALFDETASLTYRELASAVERRARELRADGVAEGSRLAVVARNDIPSVVVFAAANALGAAVLMLHERMSDAERRAAVSGFGADLVADPADGSGAPRPVEPGAGVDAVLRDGPALALTTSGTQGRPKIVQRRWAGSMANSHAYALALGLTPADRVITTSPLNHSYGLEAGVLAAFAVGAGHVIPPVPTAPARLTALVERAGCTVLQTVPALYRWYGQSGVPRLRDWKRCVSAGDALPAETADQWAREGAPLWNHYGATEIGQITAGPADPPGAVGEPVPGVAVRAESAGAAAPLLVRCPGPDPVQVIDGRAVPLTDTDGWVPMGDLGHVDDGGRVHLSGRRGSLVNIAGNKVDPAEVERAARPHPGVRDCAVVGVPGTDGVTRLYAFVEVQPGPTAFDPAALRRRLRRELGPAKVPAVIRPVAELPRTGTGKIRRWLLTEPADSPGSPSAGPFTAPSTSTEDDR
uniref:Ata18 protein n=1 Tax=Saccharothrix mutabilis subsp. capreolus TaxID=66854 RepID=Q83W17_STRMP|nr:Ata18 protein [Saccharothrix mutabilis subsp. capreolus]